MRTSANGLRVSVVLLCLFLCGTTFGQQRGVLRGRVVTSDGHVAPGVSVALKGTTRGTQTNPDGSFELRGVQPGTATVVVSFVGLQTQELEVDVKAGGVTTVRDIVLQEDARQLAAVTITANKTNPYATRNSDYVAKMPLDDLENPQVYSTISGTLLTQQLVFSVDDAIRNAPGLQKMWEATGRGGDGGAYYNARGFTLQSQLRNGVAGNVTSRIDAVNIERIEVIKGPSATLFGSTLTSYGGLINRVTKKPYSTTGGEVAWSTGSYGLNRFSVDLNTPLDAVKGLYFRVNSAYHYEGSWQDNGFERSFVVTPALRYDVNDRLSINFDAEIYSGANTGKPFIFFYYPVSELTIDRAEDAGLDYNRAYSANDLFQRYRNANFFLRADYKLSNRWTSQTNFTSTYSYSDGPLPYFYLIPNRYVTGDTTAAGADYLVRAVQATSNSEVNVKEFQQNFTGDFHLGQMRNRLVTGIDIFSQNSNQLFYGLDFDVIPKNGYIANYEKFNADKLDSALQAGQPWTYPGRYKSNTYSAYVFDVIDINRFVAISAGVRLDYFDKKGNYEPTTGDYVGGYTQTVLSPRFGIVYRAVPDAVSVFANYQNGFTNVEANSVDGRAFRPEQANQFEGGVKLDVVGGRLSATVSYYDISVEDIVRPDPENINLSIQDGTQENKGFEVGLTATPLQGLDVVAGFSYNESTYTKSDTDVEGRRPATAMSPIASNLWIGYKFDRGSLEGLGFGFGGYYASDNKVVNSDYYGEFVLPAYTVINATVFYEHARFRVAVKGNNVGNKRYWIGYTTMNPQQPRSFVGSVAFRF